MKWISYTLAGLFGLLVVVLSAAAIVLAMFDPNAYKDEIIKIVENNTGRVLTIEGPISLTYYPVFGFSVEQANLSNPADFQEESFASVGKLQAGVEVLPLFVGAIEFDTIRAEKPMIHIIRQADGTTNMDFTAPQTAPDATEETGGFSLAAGEVEISKATVQYTDQESGNSYTFEPLNFSLSSFALKKNSFMTMDAVLKTADSEATLKASADINFEPDSGLVRFQDFSADIHVTSPDMPQETNITAQGQIDIDRQAGQAVLKKGEIGWEGAFIRADGKYGWGSQKQAEFTIAATMLDIDRLLTVLTPQGQKETAPPLALPVGFLRNFSPKGTVDINTIKIAGLTLSDLHAEINGESGLIRIDPIQVKLYGGTIESARQVDARNAVLYAREKGRVENIDLARLTGDLLGEGYISGKAVVDYDISASGNTLQALIAGLGGAISFEAGEGVVNHWQLSRRINQAITYFKTGQLNPDANEQLRFTTLTGSFLGQNGVFRNDDLTLIGPEIHALGNGQVNLADKTVDYTVLVGLGDDPKDFATAEHLPVTMSGPFSAPHYGIDVQELIKEQAGQKIEEEIEEKKQEFLGKALDELGIQNETQPAGGGNDQ